MTTEIRISAAGSRPPELEIDYDGLEPPMALFEDLTMIGWTPPVAAPPPARSIDWSTPDPTTGERFTVRPYRVEGAVATAPSGSGPRGRWTDADRAAFMVALQGVLRRHGLGDASGPAHSTGALPPPPVDLPPPPAPAATPSPAARRAAAGAPGPPPPALPAPPPSGAEPEVVGLALRAPSREAAPGPGDAGESVRDSGLPAPDAGGGTGFLALSFPVGDAGRSATLSALADLEVAARVTEREVSRTVRYRGSESVRTETQAFTEVVVPAARLAEVRAAVIAGGWASDGDLLVAPLSAGALSAFLAAGPGSPTSGTGDAPPDAGGGSSPATVAIRFEARYRPAVEEALDRAGATGARFSPVRVSVTSTYRGSTNETLVPGLQLEIAVVPEALGSLTALLTSAAAVAPDDADRVTVTLPPPMAVDAGSTADPAGARHDGITAVPTLRAV